MNTQIMAILVFDSHVRYAWGTQLGLREKLLYFLEERLVGAVGIEPTTSSMPWKRAPSCATGPRLKTKSPRPPNRNRGKYRIHSCRWHSTPTHQFTSQLPRLGFQQSP